jgi:hypothetical protein
LTICLVAVFLFLAGSRVFAFGPRAALFKSREVVHFGRSDVVVLKCASKRACEFLSVDLLVAARFATPAHPGAVLLSRRPRVFLPLRIFYKYKKYIF